ncbi:MAG: hypothetical protein HY755_08745 [Nitrospirae bacterium]|nr:hypothetical protein [Nitrospirota bacterium]
MKSFARSINSVSLIIPNKSSYEYTEEEVNKIFSEIDKQLKLIKAKFLAGKRERFRL